jgi:hypothetical protein
MDSRQGPPVCASHATGTVCVATPSLQLTVIVTVNVSVAVMVAPADTVA